VTCTQPARGTLGIAPLAVPQCGQHSAQNRPADLIGVCKTAGVLPHFSQARVFPPVRMQFRGPGVSG
jgi:hypothetical protein